MSLEPGQVAVTSSSPTGGKSTLKEVEPWALTLKFVVPRSVWTAWGAGVGVVTGVGTAAVLLPPQSERDVRTAAARTARANGRLFIDFRRPRGRFFRVRWMAGNGRLGLWRRAADRSSYKCLRCSRLTGLNGCQSPLYSLPVVTLLFAAFGADRIHERTRRSPRHRRAHPASETRPRKSRARLRRADRLLRQLHLAARERPGGAVARIAAQDRGSARRHPG